MLFPEPALAGAGFAFARSPERARGDAVVVGDAEVVFLKPADLVAQPCGVLELEVGRGLAHALLEVGDVRLEVVADEVGALLVAGVDDDAVARRQMRHDVMNVALDALRRDAVLFIIFELLFAAAVRLGECALDLYGDRVGV